jgi:hypothetical protein
VLCVIDRSGGVHPDLDAMGCSVIALFTPDTLG